MGHQAAETGRRERRWADDRTALRTGAAHELSLSTRPYAHRVRRAKVKVDERRVAHRLDRSQGILMERTMLPGLKSRRSGAAKRHMLVRGLAGSQTFEHRPDDALKPCEALKLVATRSHPPTASSTSLGARAAVHARRKPSCSSRSAGRTSIDRLARLSTLDPSCEHPFSRNESLTTMSQSRGYKRPHDDDRDYPRRGSEYFRCV